MSMYTYGNDLYTGRKSFNIIGRRNVWFGIAGLLIVVSILAFFFKTPNLGIEFRGGSQFTITGVAKQETAPASKAVSDLGKDSAPRVSTVGNDSIRVQTTELTDLETQQLRESLATAYDVPAADVTSSFVGPSWGKDISSKALRAMIVFMVLVSLVLTVYFRSWTIAVGAIGALLHDFIITLGVYWVLGFEVTPATVIGVLTIMGYSLYDTVVVFDKVRENTATLQNQTTYTYAESANLAINQTLIRSLNTSITGLLPVAAVLFIGVGLLGADTLRDLALVMFVGMILSTVSSIFIAAPLAVALAERNPEIKAHTKKVLAARKSKKAARGSSSTSDASDIDDDDIDTLAPAHGVIREAGSHMGQSAQPRRKNRSKR